MKNYYYKILIPVIFLVAKTSYAQNSDFSSKPVVTIGGFINFTSAIRNEDSSFGKDRLPDTQVVDNVVDNDTGTHNKMTNNPEFTNEAEIHIKAAGINEFGMKYGAVVELEASTTNSARNKGVNADKAFIFTESRVGKLEFGNNSSVNHKMKVGPETFARGAGGINGKYLEYINMPMLADSSQITAANQIGNCVGYQVDSFGYNITQKGDDCAKIKLPRFILIPQSPISHGGYAKGFYNRPEDNSYKNAHTDADYGFNKNKSSSQIRDGSFGDLEDATKVSYYTPRISGWQFGASFTPDTGSNGTSAAISGDNSGDINRAVGYGINYSDNLGNLGFALSATGESGHFEQNSAATVRRESLRAYDIGTMVTYLGVTIGASYGNWGNSLQPKSGIYSCDYNETVTIANQDCAQTNDKKFDDSTYYTTGIAYQFGPLATSVTYLKSNFQENEYDALSFGVDYRMAKGLMPYVEVTKYQFQSNQPKAEGLKKQSSIANNDRQIQDNAGYVLLAGVLFSF